MRARQTAQLIFIDWLIQTKFDEDCYYAVSSIHLTLRVPKVQIFKFVAAEF
jgi:hypothetical protein